MYVGIKYMFNRLEGHITIFLLSQRNLFITLSRASGSYETSVFCSAEIILTALTLHYHHKIMVYLKTNEDLWGIQNKKN